jgi:hypothetical protein
MRYKPPLDRGVYRSPFLTRAGHRELVAVDHRGRRVVAAQVFRRDEEADIACMLERMLDHMDPVAA